MDPFAVSVQDLYRLLLLLFRAGALVMTVPVFGHAAIPRQLRVWIMLMLALSVFSAGQVVVVAPPPTAWHLFAVILGELAVGFLLGFAVILLFSAVQYAGHIIGLQMGLAVASVFDPMSAGQISIIGQFYYLIGMLVFLLLNGHHMVIEAFVQSYRLVPVGMVVIPPSMGELLTELTFMIFVVGIKLAAPVMITLYILNIILGIIARTVPQMNVFIVGFPLSIGIGLALIGISFPFFYIVLEKAFLGIEGDFVAILSVLGGH